MYEYEEPNGEPWAETIHLSKVSTDQVSFLSQTKANGKLVNQGHDVQGQLRDSLWFDYEIDLT